MGSRDFQEKLDELSIHELGSEQYLKSLCKLGMNFAPNSPRDTTEAFRFFDSLRDKIANVLGLDLDIEFRREEFKEIIASLDSGCDCEVISDMFRSAPYIRE